MDEEATDLCKEMFGSVSDYLSGELAATESEYQLLRRLNQISLAKYADMTELAGRLNEVAQRLNDKCESPSLLPYLLDLPLLPQSRRSSHTASR